MIAVWDDHESANDPYENGAQNHQPDKEGDWAVRKAAAKQAYREWMPVSDAAYASYQVGDLATPFRLDTRLEGRDQQFDLGKLIEGQTNPQAMTAARTRVFKAALAADANLLVLAGDTHNGWAFALDREGAKVGVELGVCSVSSPGFEAYLSAVPPATMAASLVAENAQLTWADTAQRGYMAVELTPTRAVTEYRFTGGVRQRSTKLAGTKRITADKASGKLAV